MENTLQTFSIQEKDLELVISNQQLGVLTTNAKDIKALIEKVLPNYDVANYNESNIDLAKKDKAMLNKASKVLNDKRIELEKQFMGPFSEFKDVITDTCKLIKTATDKIDTVVKESEAKEKETKRTQIVEYFNGLNFNLVSLERFFDDKWLNKTAKIKDVQKEILEQVNRFKDDLNTIETIGNDVELLKSIYLDTLNMNSTYQYAKTLQENREKAQRDAEEKAKTTAPVPATAAPSEDENPFAQPSTEPSTEVPSTDKQALLERTMKVVATYDQLVALGNFMNDNGIHFEKL